ncbi:hypothetical protein [Rubritalea marina]|uniref:hypothetical protein n=1 Tax=Rubritalea marina TaxID=361055 RepID=UPI0003788653|nr:hypothetical protein [Rubritalea marina]
MATTDNTAEDPQLTQKEIDAQIVLRQNFVVGCSEMERITDDIIIPVFSEFTKCALGCDIGMDVTLLDFESPLDFQLYNVGVRLDFEYEGKEISISLIADPSDFSYAFDVVGSDQEITEVMPFHSVVPHELHAALQQLCDAHFPQIKYVSEMLVPDAFSERFVPPFRVQYDDNGNVSDVATTQTLTEAANMGSTFAKMFKKEEAITIIDSRDTVAC